MVGHRRNVSSESPWEAKFGYSRAVRLGPSVWVSGTTATDGEGRVLCEGDMFAQARLIFEKIERALSDAGARMSDVVRTRMYVTDLGRWEEVGRAHGEVFGEICPCATLVQVAGLVDPAMLVEIEVEAVVSP